MCLSNCSEEGKLIYLLKPSCKEGFLICSLFSISYINMWFGSNCELQEFKIKEFMLKEFIFQHTRTGERTLFYHQTKWVTIFPRRRKKLEFYVFPFRPSTDINNNKSANHILQAYNFLSFQSGHSLGKYKSLLISKPFNTKRKQATLTRAQNNLFQEDLNEHFIIQEKNK